MRGGPAKRQPLRRAVNGQDSVVTKDVSTRRSTAGSRKGRKWKGLKVGHLCPKLGGMKPTELLRRLRRLAARRGWEIEISEGGNHTKVTLNNRRSVIGRHATDLKAGTFHAILRQLGLRPEDLEN